MFKMCGEVLGWLPSCAHVSVQSSIQSRITTAKHRMMHRPKDNHSHTLTITHVVDLTKLRHEQR